MTHAIKGLWNKGFMDIGVSKVFVPAMPKMRASVNFINIYVKKP
jgi:hypothetical protein